MRLSTILAFIISCVSAQDRWWEPGIAKTLNDRTFLDVVGKDKHVFVEFFAEWCHWCRQMHPELVQLAEMHMGANPIRNDVIIAKIDGGSNVQTAYKYQIGSYPTLVLFKKDSTQIAAKFTWQRTAPLMAEWIKQMLGPEEVVAPSPALEVVKTEMIDIPIIDPADVHDIPNPVAEIPKVEVPPPIEITGTKIPKIEIAEIKSGNRSPEEYMKDLEERVLTLQKQLEQTKQLAEENQVALREFQHLTVEKIESLVGYFHQQKSKIDEIKTFNEDKLGKIHENLAQVGNGTGGNTVSSNINSSHATIFIILGMFVGVGMAFAFVNYRKISKKKKYLVD